ncbi:hypothetical protein ACFLRF_00530 [Candidatus Altiarchaeota archaeon]
MKKILTALVVLSMISMVSAMSNVQTLIGNMAGETKYTSMATIAGTDWSEGQTMQVTGGVQDCFSNIGGIQIANQIYTPGEWEMVQQTAAQGTGVTEISKLVEVWTEDMTLWENGADPWRNPDGVAGEYAYPTHAWIDVQFETPSFKDTQAAEFFQTQVLGTDDGESAHAIFNKLINTDDKFKFGEQVGIGLCNDCELPELDECLGPFCEV